METKKNFNTIETIKKTVSAYFKVNHVLLTLEKDFKKGKKYLDVCIIACTNTGEIIEIAPGPIEIMSISDEKIIRILRAKCYALKQIREKPEFLN